MSEQWALEEDVPLSGITEQDRSTGSTGTIMFKTCQIAIRRSKMMAWQYKEEEINYFEVNEGEKS